jgi:flagellin-specific chaperone FliS
LQQNSDEGDLGVKNGKTHCKEIIQNLWSILDQEIEIDIIVNLLRQFDIFVPKIFSSVVVENLNSKVKDTR